VSGLSWSGDTVIRRC